MITNLDLGRLICDAQNSLFEKFDREKVTIGQLEHLHEFDLAEAYENWIADSDE